MTATAQTRKGPRAFGRVRPPRWARWRPLACVVVAFVATALASAVALARTTAARIGNGVVVIKTTLGYQGATAAGTGMVLTSSGEILTNNHVIRGATKVTVVVPGTSHVYTAKVVGYDVADDVAVLRAAGATDLATVTTAASSKVAVGDRVTAVGNAGGTGALSSVRGAVTELQRSIVVSDDSGGAARLTGLIGADADVVPGDSGGPLLNSAGTVIGMNTAGSTGYASATSTATQAYAIPIGKALSIVRQIEAGRASARIHIGATSFLGVQVASALRNGDFSSPGAVIAGVLRGSPAAAAGLSAGDVITAIDGHATSTPSSITAAILAKKPGTKVTIRLTDRSGGAHSTRVILASGPAQ
jgi:S1-C subfamily serine protease